MILVTGASGFLGGRLAQVLRERGNAIRVLARATSNLSHLPAVDISTDPREAVRGVSTIFHCAAKSADWGPRAEFQAANVELVRYLAEAAIAEGIERFVQVSSTDVYGYPKTPCDEAHPLVRRGLPYNETKIDGEQIVWSAIDRGLAVTVIRPSTIYGPRSESTVGEFASLLARGEMAFVSGGQVPAGLVYVDDVVEAMIAASSEPATIGRAYNIRHPEAITWREYVETMADYLGVKRPTTSIPTSIAFSVALVSEIFAGKKRPRLTRHAVYLLARDQSYEIERARAEFGFAPRTSFAEGMARTMDWWKRRAI